MTAWYNEINLYAAAWLRNLIAAGHIAPGVVDTRSIVDVSPDDLVGFTQVHFFAGLGGWSLAARLAGWPDDKPLWTGSCPCQPFSAAGKRKGTEDARHLWPEMRRLVAARNPDVVAGEQVASKDGRTWLAGVRADLEALGYGVGAADLCAASVGAPHIRQRLWWLADAAGERRAGVGLLLRAEEGGRDEGDLLEAAGRGATGRMADADGGLACDRGLQRGGQHGQQPQDGRSGGVEHAASDGREQRRTEPGGRGAVGRCSIDGLVDAEHARLEGHAGHGHNSGQPGWLDANTVGPITAAGDPGFWSTYSVVHCTDGKARRFEPGSFPLAHGVSSRVGRLRAYGNAIVPQVAAEVLGAWLDRASTNSSVTSP
jgi:DNA (cytosine-5)-methyltransferase 1